MVRIEESLSFCPPERNFSEISVGVFLIKGSDFIQEGHLSSFREKQRCDDPESVFNVCERWGDGVENFLSLQVLLDYARRIIVV